MVDADGIIRINYLPREQFIPFHNRTQRYACLVCHRRAGKTLASLHDLVRGALRCARNSPRFAYVAPFRAQAKQVVWSYLLEAIGPLRAIGATAHESELRVDLHNSGQVRLYGADNPDALRGIYLDGCVLDEFADMDPRTWSAVLSPALSDRRGWATFIGTPKGKNAFWEIWQQSQGINAKGEFDQSLKDRWFSMMLKASESGLIGKEELEEQRLTKSEDEYEQEYECSFDAAVQGTYYGRLISDADSGGRIVSVPYDRSALVYTAWDIGIGDKTAIWWVQTVGREIRILDYYEANGADIAHFAEVVSGKPYAYGGHWLPHDAASKELGTGKSIVEMLEGLLLRNVSVVPHLRVEQGINAARMILPRCWFDKDKCRQGLECLRMYRSEFDDKRKVYRTTPLHDWASDGADAFRYLALMVDKHSTVSKFNRDIEYPRLGII